jgi:hypothetical protein
MLNRFENCKTLEDLHAHFNEDTCDYNNVSADELETIAEVFKANVDVREMPDTPLTDKGYAYVLNYVIDVVEGRDMEIEEEIISNTIKNNKEDVIMSNNNSSAVDAAVENLMKKFRQNEERFEKDNTSEKHEEFVDKTDDSLNSLKEAFSKCLNILDEVFGYSLLKNSILEMIDASLSDGEEESLSRMAKKCRELIEEEIDRLKFWGDQDSLKKATQLEPLVEGCRGKSIFEAFVSGCIYIVDKVTERLENKLDIENMRNGLIKYICKGVRVLVNVLKTGLRIVWSATKFAGSFIISGVIITAEWLFHTIKEFISKAKNWAEKKSETVSEEDDSEDESDGVFGTNLA